MTRRAESPRLARCGAKFNAPPLMGWHPPPCDKPDGHKNNHRSVVWLNDGRDYTQQRELTCSWPDGTRPNPSEGVS